MAHQNFMFTCESNKLEDIEKELKRYKSEMEHVVRIRTMDLIKANNRLQLEAVERELAQEQNARKSQLLDAINKVLQSAISDRDEKVLTRSFLNAARELTSSPFGFVLEKKNHRVQGSWQVMAVCTSAEDLSAKEVYESSGILGMNEPLIEIWQRLVNHDGPLIWKDEHGAVPDTLFKRAPAISGMLAVPLKYDGKISGFVALANNRQGYAPVDQKDVQTLAQAFCEALLRKRYEQDKHLSEERLNLALKSANEGLWDYWPQKDTMYFSPQWFAMLGYLPGEFPSSLGTWINLTHPKDLAVLKGTFEEATTGIKDDFSIEIRMLTKSGEWRWIRASGRTSHNLQQEVIRVLGTIGDITKYKQVEIALQKANEELQRLAALDGLTQIANRRRFDDLLTLEWRRALRENKSLAVIMCDIDFFKDYNDTYGHVKGDDALCAVAQAIEGSLKRPMDLVARYGGEEFAILLPNTDIEGATRVADELKQAIDKLNIEHAASPVRETISLSFGVAAVTPDGNMQPKELVEAADRSLYLAKTRGRNQIVHLRLHSELQV